MSNKNLGIILLSSVLTLGTAPLAFPRAGQENTQQPASGSQRQTGSTTSGMQDSTTTSQDQTTTTTNKKKTTKSKSSNAGTQSKDDVKQVQMVLQQKGFDPGTIDGIMGPQTKKAIAGFQRQQNLYVSGKLDQQTLTALG